MYKTFPNHHHFVNGSVLPKFTTMKSIFTRCARFFFLLGFVLLASLFVSAADVAGDYRCITTGSNLNWSTLSTWQRYNGSTWATPTAAEGYPGQYAGTGKVTIRNSTTNTIKLNVSPANAIGSLQIGEAGATSSNYGLLENGSGSRDLDITGSLDFAAYGEFNLVSVFGSHTYNITIGGDITSTSTSEMDLRSQEIGNIILNGTNQTISGGGAFNADSWTLSNNGTVYLNTNINAGGLSVGANAVLLPDAAVRINAGGASGILSGSGTVHCTRTASTPTLAYQMQFSTYTLTNITLYYSGAGNQTIAGYTVKALLTDGSGIKTCSAGFSASNGVTVGTGTTLNPAAYTSTVGSALNVNGTLDFTSSTGLLRTATSGTTTITMGTNGLIRTLDATGLGPVSNASLQTQGSGVWSEGNSETVGTIEYYTSGTQTITDRNYNNLIITNSSNKTWTPAATRTVNGNITVQGSFVTAGSNTINLSGDMQINSGTFSISSSATYNVSGNWNNSSTFSPGSSTVNFVNTGAGQAMGGTTTNPGFYNLGVTMGSQNLTLGGSIANLTISNQLTLNSGVIVAGSIPVIISTNTPGAVTSSGGYVSGTMQRSVTNGSGYLFAVGTSSGYTPATYDFSSVTGTGSVSVQSNDGVGSNYPATLHASKRLARNWSVTKSGITAYSANANFSYLSGDLAGGATDANLHPYIASPAVSYPTFTTSSNSFALSGVSADGEIGAGECLGTLAASFSKTWASSCNGGTDGTITVTASGGTNPYSYSWTGPGGYSSNLSAITGLSLGDYTIVVSDVSKCSFTIPDISIHQALTPSLTSNGTPTATCVNDGTVTLYPAYGVAPYTYSLDGVTYQAGTLFTGLAAGTYTAYIKDLQGCIGTKSVTVASVPALGLTYATLPSGSCVNNGQIILTRSGGKAPFTYSKDGVTYQPGNILTNMPAGTSTSYVKDASGCIYSISTTVSSLTAVSASVSSSASGACASNGSVTVNGSGGRLPYTYSIDNVTYVGTNVFTGLGAGSYTGWVKDADGCTSSAAVNVGSSPAVSVTASSSSSSSCVNNGSITIRPAGGRSPFTYSLDDVTYQASAVFSNLAGGNYTAWAKSADGCKASVLVTVNQAPSVTASAHYSNSSSCDDDGTIQGVPLTGTQPYTYSLDGVSYQGSKIFTGLAAGSYTLYVKDATGCTTTVPVTISTTSFTATNYTWPATACANADGSIRLFLSGGIAPYTYSIDGVTYVASPVFSGLTAGTYTGYVKDSKGCIATTSCSVGPSCPRIPIAKLYRPVSPNSEFGKVYPNPSNGAFNIQVNPMAKTTRVRVSDLAGRVISISDENGGKSILRLGANWKAGVYFVELVQDGVVKTIRLVKQ